MAELRVKKKENLGYVSEPFDNNSNYQKVLRFADEKLSNELKDCVAKIKERNENARLNDIYRRANKRKKIIITVAPILCACVVLIIVLTKVIIPNSKYNAAVTLMNEGNYLEAMTAFEAMNGYKDSEAQITACQTAIKDIDYNNAVTLMNEGKYTEAIAAFKAMNGYKDSEAQIENYYIGKFGEEKWNKIKNIKVGDNYTFGSYEQDNNTSNGKEEIEWLVLAREDNRILVISEKALDCKPYYAKDKNVTWETCSLREWMNNTFYNEAFSAEEQSRIQSAAVTADSNPKYDTSPGNNTEDKVFLLSVTEAEKYFSSDEARKCVPTAYAISQGAYTSSDYTKNGEKTCSWWLRSPGYSQEYAASVRNAGSVNDDGYLVFNDNIGVRPALWINLES